MLGDCSCVHGQAREYLHYKVFGKQHVTPVAIMTSAAKKNNERVLNLCEKHDWFGRGRENFCLFEQVLFPHPCALKNLPLIHIENVLQPKFSPISSPFHSLKGYFIDNLIVDSMMTCLLYFKLLLILRMVVPTMVSAVDTCSSCGQWSLAHQ